jgi:hypothetical protein
MAAAVLRLAVQKRGPSGLQVRRPNYQSSCTPLAIGKPKRTPPPLTPRAPGAGCWCFPPPYRAPGGVRCCGRTGHGCGFHTRGIWLSYCAFMAFLPDFFEIVFFKTRYYL